MNIKVQTLLAYTVFAFYSTYLEAQTPASGITAEQILQIAIDSSGGEKRLKTNNTVEYITQVITVGNDTLSFAIKKSGFKKNYISILSLTHVNSTRIYNNGKAIDIINDTVRELTDPNLRHCHPGSDLQ